VGTGVAVALLAAAPALSAGPRTTRVTVKSNGQEVSADADLPSVSGTGRFVSFESVGHFTKGDDGTDADVFVHDRATGKTTRASVMSNGKEASGVDCEDSSISANGRFVAFDCNGPLVAGDNNGYDDVYVHDRKTGATVRASVTSDHKGVMADAVDPSLSANGRYVAFDSDGAFVPSDANGVEDVYVHDLKSGKTKLASVRSDGDPTDQDSKYPSISGDGRYVAFQSYDNSMTSDPEGQFPGVDEDVFVRDMKAGATTRVSIKANGQEADPGSQQNILPAISANGKFVAFTADAYGDFAPTDNNTAADVYVKNLGTGKLQRASVTSGGTEGPLGSGSDAPAAISANGRYVAFESYNKLAPQDHNPAMRDVYLHDRKTRKTTLVSVKSNGDDVPGYQHQLPSISEDGSFVAFSSMGAFTGGDSGTDFDVFERGALN
jgi:Tol biopolymer transport system component